MKKLIILFSFLICLILPVKAAEVVEYSESAILVESTTGKVLYEKDADLERAPASMTKIMSMILIMDAINNGNLKMSDDVVISEHASSMGGSQVYLNTGETYKVKELLKSIAIASANDAVTAMAEKIGGTEDKFVEMMNNKCKELGCTHTNFVNPHGLDALKNKIIELFNLNGIKSKNYNYLSNARQVALVKKAYEAINNAIKSVDELYPLEMIAVDIKKAYDDLGEIIGATYKDELLDELFSKFCLGK